MTMRLHKKEAWIIPNWDRVRRELKKIISDQQYRTWIEPLKVKSESNGQLTLAAPNSFSRQWVIDKYSDGIQITARKCYSRPFKPIKICGSLNKKTAQDWEEILGPVFNPITAHELCSKYNSACRRKQSAKLRKNLEQLPSILRVDGIEHLAKETQTQEFLESIISRRQRTGKSTLLVTASKRLDLSPGLMRFTRTGLRGFLV